MKSARSIAPPLRMLAALPPRDADILLTSAAHASRALEPGAMHRAMRRILAYRCSLGLPHPVAQMADRHPGLTRARADRFDRLRQRKATATATRTEKARLTG